MMDRVPITPTTRADVPFQVMNMNCMGPLAHRLRRGTSILFVCGR